MRRFLAGVLGCALLGGVTVLAVARRSAPRALPTQNQPGRATLTRLQARYGRLPLSFERNVGQAADPVKFLSRTRGYAVYVAPSEVSFMLSKKMPQSVSRRTALQGGGPGSSLLRLKLVGADPAAKVDGLKELPGKSNYFLGNDPKAWRTNISNFAGVEARDVYPGVDLVYHGSATNAGELELDFVVAPGADPKAIRMEIDGVVGARHGVPLHLAENGDLIVVTQAGEVRFHKPVAYQPDAGSFADRVAGDLSTREESGGVRPPLHQVQRAGVKPPQRHYIHARYVLKGDRQVGFEVAVYDPSKPLIIDPVLSYGTYLGGGAADLANAIAVDGSGNVYVAGSTASTNFPTGSPAQGASGGGTDAFVAKLDATGSTLVYATYLGGSGFDRATGLALDSSGNAYVVGSTGSSDFPTTKGAFKTTAGGNGDAFVAKLNASGSTLAYSSYLGGSGADFGQGIAVDSSGNAYVTGSTESTNFPTVGAVQSSSGGASDAFVAKVKADGTALTYSTYLGGSAADAGQAIAVDASGSAYVTGFTFSTNFPVSNALQKSNAGNADAFVAKLNPGGSALVYSTFLGGNDRDRGFGIAVDGSGNAYVTGDSQSTDFPTTSGAFQTLNSGNGDAFVSKLAADGSALVYSTFLGGTSAEQGFGIAVDGSGGAYVTGFTQSSDFPTANALQSALAGGSCGGDVCPDTFVTRLDPKGGSLAYSTYLGGGGADIGQAIAIDSSQNAFVAGSAASSDFPVTVGAFQTSYLGTGSLGDAFVAKVGPADAPAAVLLPPKLSFADQASGTTSADQAVTLANFGNAALNIAGISVSGDFAQTNDCGTSLAAGGAKCTVKVTFSPKDTGARSGQLTVTDNAASSPHIVSLSGTGVQPAPAASLSPTSLTFPDQTFGATSAAQTVTLTNTGTAPLSITSINISGDFAQTNSCPASLAVGAKCVILVTFTPAATGSRTGALSVADNASGSPHNVNLKGNGVAVFSLSASQTSVTVTIGATSATFDVSDSAPASFADNISLTCTNAGQATCSFNPSILKPGQSSTLTVNNLSASTANPLNFTLNGTSGAQTATLDLRIVFADFSLSASPPLATIAAGQSASYTVSIQPANGFNQAVSLTCLGAPQATTCSVTPTSATPGGSEAVTASVAVKTTARSAVGPREREHRIPPPAGRWPWVLGLLALASVAILAAQRKVPQRVWVGLAVAALLALPTAACNDFITSPVGILRESGTPVGNYTLVITGTFTSGSTKISRSTTLNLAVS